MPKISIIIPTYNNCDYLKACIDSVLKYTDLSNIEIIVIANGCTDGTQDYLNSLPSGAVDAIYFDQPLGYAKAVNEGINAARGDFVVLLNNDTALLNQSKNQWLEMLLEAFHNPLVGIAGPLMNHCPHAGRDFLIFFCVMIKREVINKIGLLDEIFTVGAGEDTDYCIRSEDAGYKLAVVPDNYKTFDENQKLWVNHFPIYHKGGATVHNEDLVKDWDTTIAKNRNILADKYKKSVILPDGPFWDGNIKTYRDAISIVPNGGIIAELGVWKGRSLASVADLLISKDIKVIAVDTFSGSPGESAMQLNAQRESIKDIFQDTLERFNISDRVRVLHMTTEEASDIVEDSSLDLVFIDADHSYQAVKNDITKWHPKVKPTGMIMGHDFDMGHIGVTMAVNEYFGNQFSEENYIWCHSNAAPITYNYQKNRFVPVTVDVLTKSRYYSTLPSCLLSITQQTVIPTNIIIVDDTPINKRLDMREIPIYQSIFALFDRMGISWEVIFGDDRGMSNGHNMIIDRASTEFIWRVDDDQYIEPNVLETVCKLIGNDPMIGAASCSILDPKGLTILDENNDKTVNSLKDIFTAPNFQWVKFNKPSISSAEHLYSSFIFRKSFSNHKFNTELSKVAHREDTIFTHTLLRNGWKLMIDTSATIWHLREPKGGIREDGNTPDLWAHDEEVFKKKLLEWGYSNTPQQSKLVVLDNGLGDHLMFKSILPEVIEKYKNVTIAVCYPEVFQDCDVEIISISEAAKTNNLDNYNIYKWCSDRNWNQSIIDAFRGMYL